MIYSELVRKAMNIAFEAHAEQKDKAGYPYIHHPMHLAEQMTDEYSACVALMHDVIEDCPSYTFEYLENEGFPKEVIDALKLMTHATDVPYPDYVKAIKSNPIATRVKIADLMHNLDQTRFPDGREPKKKQLYLEALEYLKS